jgi:hypothetical protein
MIVKVDDAIMYAHSIMGNYVIVVNLMVRHVGISKCKNFSAITDLSPTA